MFVGIILVILLGAILIGLCDYAYHDSIWTRSLIYVLGLALLGLGSMFLGSEVLRTGQPTSSLLNVGEYNVLAIRVENNDVYLIIDLQEDSTETVGSNSANNSDDVKFYHYKVADFSPLDPNGTRLIMSKSPSGLLSMELLR